MLRFIQEKLAEKAGRGHERQSHNGDVDVGARRAAPSGIPDCMKDR